MSTSKVSPFKIVLLLIGILIIPAALVLNTVKYPGEFKLTSDNPTPLGYSWSLLMFIIPILAILIWLHLNRELKLLQRAFWMTILGLVPLGFILDILFGSLFFNFLNQKATLGINLPGYDFETHHWAFQLPIEEFVFYLTGFVAVLILYLWCDEYWLAAYNVQNYKSEVKPLKRILSFHPFSLLIGVLLIAIVILYKKFGNHPYRAGFPGYFMFLTMTAIMPSILFFSTVRSFINWRAFSFTFYFITMISLIWEATLGIPYQWWGYNYDQMMGITIDAWYKLPIEAVLVWISVSFTTIIIFEMIKIRLNMSERTLLNALTGYQKSNGDQ